MDVNFYETLCMYCADNDIDLDSVSDADFDGAVMAMEAYGTCPRGEYHFWIDG